MSNSNYRTLHIFNDPKFSKGYFKFLRDNDFDLRRHRLFHYRTHHSHYPDYGIPTTHAAHFASIAPNLSLLWQLIKADKIIVHCLAAPALLLYLFLFPTLAKKCYWVIWGKDLYFYSTLIKKRFYHKLYEFFRKRVIPNIRNIVSDNQGDIKLLQEWYGVTPKNFPGFTYPSNLYKEAPLTKRANNTVTILVGNSADSSNNHLEAFALLAPSKDRDIEIFAPLSYGNKQYAVQVAQKGKQLFGQKFKALTELLPTDEYLALLARIDIAIFAHERQQAMGNIITLLGMGKNVYIRNDISTWNHLHTVGVKINALEDFSLALHDQATKEHNRHLIKTAYSPQNLIAQWQSIFAASPTTETHSRH